MRRVSSVLRRAASARTVAVDLDSHHGKTRSLDTSRPEGLFTELESAMDATSSHLLAAETIVDTSLPDDTTDIGRMVSQSILPP